MNADTVVRCRFHFQPGQRPADQPPPVPAVMRGCVVKVNNAAGPAANRKHLVHSTNPAAGLAYLGMAIGESGTFEVDDTRVARFDDLTVIRGPVFAEQADASGEDDGADYKGEIPPDVVAAYATVVRFLEGIARAA